MNKIVCSFLIAAMAVCGAQVSRARAEGDGPKRGPGRHGPWGEDLGLSKDQKAKLEAAKKAQWEASQSARREIRDAMTKLRDQVEDKASDKEISATLERVKSAHKALQAQMEKFHDAAAGILTPTQRAKMLLSRGHHMKMMMGMMGRGEGCKGGSCGRGPGFRPKGFGGPEGGPRHRGDDDEAEEHEPGEHEPE